MWLEFCGKLSDERARCDEEDEEELEDLYILVEEHIEAQLGGVHLK